MNKCDKCIELWDDIFSKQESVLPKKKESGNVEFDKGLAWLTDNAYRCLILDVEVAQHCFCVISMVPIHILG